MKEYAELENFIRKHYAALHTSALKFVKSEAAAQDITQEVIIRYWENQEKCHTIESVENFLFVMIKNEALNYLRGLERENKRYARLENKEISRLLKVSVNTVKTLKYSAIRKLREHFQK